MQRPPDAVTPVMQCPGDEIAAKTTPSPTRAGPLFSPLPQSQRRARRTARELLRTCTHPAPRCSLALPVSWLVRPSAQPGPSISLRRTAAPRTAGESEARAHHCRGREGTKNTGAHLIRRAKWSHDVAYGMHPLVPWARAHHGAAPP
jgi:hypothetical protein